LLRTPSPRPEESIFAAWSSPLLRRMWQIPKIGHTVKFFLIFLSQFRLIPL
jgi:hypothetical protein